MGHFKQRHYYPKMLQGVLNLRIKKNIDGFDSERFGWGGDDFEFYPKGGSEWFFWWLDLKDLKMHPSMTTAVGQTSPHTPLSALKHLTALKHPTSRPDHLQPLPQEEFTNQLLCACHSLTSILCSIRWFWSNMLDITFSKAFCFSIRLLIAIWIWSTLVLVCPTVILISETLL